MKPNKWVWVLLSVCECLPINEPGTSSWLLLLACVIMIQWGIWGRKPLKYLLRMFIWSKSTCSLACQVLVQDWLTAYLDVVLITLDLKKGCMLGINMNILTRHGTIVDEESVGMVKPTKDTQLFTVHRRDQQKSIYQNPIRDTSIKVTKTVNLNLAKEKYHQAGAQAAGTLTDTRNCWSTMAGTLCLALASALAHPPPTTKQLVSKIR